MEIKEMTFAEIEERVSQIKVSMNEEGANLDELLEEVNQLEERKAELKANAEKRANLEKMVNANEGITIVEEVKEERKEEKEMGNITESKEYRDAFFANLVGKATVEQRAMFADNTTYGDGIALPVATDKAIWDQTISKHPILDDVAIVKSGIVLKVSQATVSNLGTSGGVKAKKDSDAIVELQFTTNEKVLAGKDYTTFVTLSYAEAKMSAGAMETFLVNEIANALGEELAKDVFAQILTDASANSVTKSGTYYEAIKEALGKATQANAPVIYAPSALYYAILGEVDTNGQPIVRDGVVLGAPLKKDNGATKITIVEPDMFVLNVVADVKITSQEIVAKGGYDIGGYMRAEGCLRKANAGAFIA